MDDWGKHAYVEKTMGGLYTELGFSECGRFFVLKTSTGIVHVWDIWEGKLESPELHNWESWLWNPDQKTQTPYSTKKVSEGTTIENTSGTSIAWIRDEIDFLAVHRDLKTWAGFRLNGSFIYSLENYPAKNVDIKGCPVLDFWDYKS